MKEISNDEKQGQALRWSNKVEVIGVVGHHDIASTIVELISHSNQDVVDLKNTIQEEKQILITKRLDPKEAMTGQEKRRERRKNKHRKH